MSGTTRLLPGVFVGSHAIAEGTTAAALEQLSSAGVTLTGEVHRP